MSGNDVRRSAPRDARAPSAAIAARIGHLQRQAMALSQAGRPRRALQACRQILALQPERADVLAFAGTLALRAGDAAEAAALYRRALALRPDFAEIHYNLGNALDALGRREDAVAAYRRALALQQTAAGERDLGIALHELGRLDEAIAAYRRALALPGHRIDVLSNLANALMEKGDRSGTLE